VPYWWWMYLKREPDYLNTCEKGGVGVCDELYLDFGDVRGDDFKSWWQDGNRGVELFSEPPTGIKRILDSGDKVPPVTVALTVSFPLVFTKDRMEKDFQKILRRLQNHDGTLGQHRYMRSQAKYPVLGNPTPRALEIALKVFDMKQANPKMTLWEIGNAIPEISPVNKVNPDERRAANQVTNKKSLESATSRYLRTANDIMDRVGFGKFPYA
jgi:hypothetical protein